MSESSKNQQKPKTTHVDNFQIIIIREIMDAAENKNTHMKIIQLRAAKQ